MTRSAPLAALWLLAACAHTTSRYALPADPNAAGGVPVRVVSASASATYLFDRGPYGDDTEAKAVARARGRDLETSLFDAVVEHRSSCFPSCESPWLLRRVTTVTGTLVKPTHYSDATPAPAAPAGVGRLDPVPSVEALCARLEGLYRDDPASAKEFYDSLDASSRGLLREYVVAAKGIKSAYGRELRLPKATPPGERAFVEWFVKKYTDYQVVEE